jgi:glycosyltransferase involved in cell wall biosynthesis
MESNMRVVQLISSGGCYGAENMLLTLASSFERIGVETILLVFHNLHRPNLEFAERARARGLSVHILPCKGRTDWTAVQGIRECMREYAVDVLHTHGYKADLFGYLAAKLERKPIISTCHNWTRGAALNLYYRLDRWMLKRFNMVVAVSDNVAEKLKLSGISGSRIRVVSNGIDASLLQNASPSLRRDFGLASARVIGMVARLDMQKGFEYLLPAFREILKEFPDALLVLVGDGPARTILDQMVCDLRIEQNVIFAGVQADMACVYASIDLLVLPSLNEGLPMTLLEAMSAARPVVATRVGAIPEVIVDGQTGLLVDPGTTTALTAALARLLRSPQLCLHLGSQAQSWVRRHYTSQSMVEKYLQVYKELLMSATDICEPHLPVSSSGPSARGIQ